MGGFDGTTSNWWGDRSTTTIPCRNKDFKTATWLKYSQFIQEQPELIRSISFGGENCFDMGWCHFAKSNMTGRQQHGIMWDKDISFRNDQTFLLMEQTQVLLADLI
eukprot:scaffold20006_cov94-Skeletonema_menzelii.AAC.1